MTAARAHAPVSRNGCAVDRTRDVVDALVRSESGRVARMLVLLLGQRADLEDLVQTVFLEFFRSWPAMRDKKAVSAFIRGITVRVARRALRPSWWHRVRCSLVGDAPSLEPGPEVAATVSEQSRRVRLVLEKLSVPKREPFILWAVDGLSVEAIAEMTGCSVAAIRSRIFYAQKELKLKALRDPYLKELLSAGDLEAGRR